MEKKPWPIFFFLFFSLFFAIGYFTFTLMASPYIVSELGGSNDIATYTVTFYCMGNTWGIPLGHHLCARLGTVRVLICCLLGLSLLSFFSIMVTTYPLFLTLRFAQGAVAGPLYFVVSSLLSFCAREEKRATVVTMIATMFTVVPVLAASWGGWIAYDYNWRFIFIINIPILLFLIIGIWSFMKSLVVPCKKEPFNFVSYVFFAIGIASIGSVFLLGQEMDWFRSNLIITLTILGVVCFSFFVIWDLFQEHPLFELRLLKNIPFLFALINLAGLFSAYFGMILLLSLWLNLYVNYTPIWIGVLVGTMSLAGFVPYFLIKGRFGRSDTRIPLLIAILLFGFSCYYTTFFSEFVDFKRIAFSRIIAGFGLVFFLPPIFRLCFHSFEEEKFPKVLVLFQVVRAFFSGLGASVYTTLWLRRTVFFHERMGEQLTPFSTLTDGYFEKADDFGLKGLIADAELNKILERSAVALGLDDTFYAMAIALFSLLVLLIATLSLPKKGFRPELSRTQE